MKIEEVISKAIEGGYKSLYNLEIILDEEREVEIIHELLLDPNFWKCLGKAMGWKDKSVCCLSDLSLGNSTRKDDLCRKCGKVAEHNNWLYYWHKFIDHLAEGKTPEQFFGEIKDNQKEI